PSSTTELTRLLARYLTERTGAEVQFIELRDVASHLADATTLGFPAPTLADALEAVESADLLIAPSATFRGSYAGLRKACFDLVRPEDATRQRVPRNVPPLERGAAQDVLRAPPPQGEPRQTRRARRDPRQRAPPARHRPRAAPLVHLFRLPQRANGRLRDPG